MSNCWFEIVYKLYEKYFTHYQSSCLQYCTNLEDHVNVNQLFIYIAYW